MMSPAQRHRAQVALDGAGSHRSPLRAQLNPLRLRSGSLIYCNILPARLESKTYWRPHMRSLRVMWNAVRLLAVLAVAILASENALGQGITTGSIAGTIADPQGAVVQGAAITATEAASNAAFKTVSGADGLFAFH